jgi:metal-responsive CopG/Arc/MetJ family transcriptional regulator
MKTAISIPDKTFDKAERFAKARGMTRSELYRRAVEDYLQRYSEEALKKELDALYSEEDSSVDPVMQELQYRSLQSAEREGE